MLLKATQKKIKLYCQGKSTIAVTNIQHYREKPVEFCSEILDKILTNEQQQILISVIKNPITLAVAGHAVGKTSVAAWLVLWWVFARGGMAITTAPTRRQVQHLLWREIEKAHSNNKEVFGGKLNLGSLTLDAGKGSAIGFTARTTAEDTSSFQGIHDEDLLLIIDEANARNLKGVWDGAIACVTGAGNRLLALGNPTSAGTEFYRHCLKRSPIEIAVWSHPNVEPYYQEIEIVSGTVAEKIHRLLPGLNPLELPQKIPGAVSPQWIEEVRETYGENSIYWKCRLNAQFPSDIDLSVCPESWFEAAIISDFKLNNSGITIGVDVANGGDEHALAAIQQGVAFKYHTLPTYGDGEDIGRLVEEVLSLIKSFPYAIPVTVGIDAIGVGAGAVSELRIKVRADADLAGRTIVIVGICWAEKSSKPKQFKNLKAEHHYKLKEKIKTRYLRILLGLHTEKLRTQLCKIHFAVPDGDSAIQVESRKFTIERLKGNSPDLAHALILANSLPPPISGAPNTSIPAPQNLLSEYNSRFTRP
ncbi:hypothetical protein [Kamptonema sp. UHCC 0994]|uniref:hypothetical protein n=1 Tax=Kamptonema sp. UHCC 0994 TaxID=3031329 RepID=UPI0023B9A41A|nr:hypothetical protein [Kamptonema sp. UHCC 0994]MDF0554903.1 hypothetical protein [Kamptonema sp. UHCC 0994]